LRKDLNSERTKREHEKINWEKTGDRKDENNEEREESVDIITL